MADLQAILDGSDSSSNEDDDNMSYPVVESVRKESVKKKIISTTIADPTIDLEQILREDEDDDDFDENMNSSPLAFPYNNKNESNRTILSSTKLEYSSPAAESSPLWAGNSSQQQPTHNEYDWAVLQAILREDDDDGDDDDNQQEKNILQIKQQHTPKQQLHTPKRDTTARNAIEHLLDSEEHDPNPNLAFLPNLSDNRNSIRNNNNNNNKYNLQPRYNNNNNSTATAIAQPSFHDIQSPAVEIHTEDAYNLADQEDSRTALEQAQSYERRLLKAGHRDIVSPLMVKRRLKPKIALAKRNDAVPPVPHDSSHPIPAAPPARATSNTTSVRSTSTHSGRFYTLGLIENKTLEDISVSIRNHAALNAKIKAGLPTCLAFNSRFIAVGTQLGIVLLFDFFGVLRQRLGASAYETNDTSAIRMMGAITSVDLNFNGECCAVGYKTGVIVIWDTIRGTVLRSVDDLHPSPILSCRFYGDLKLISADAGGLVNKTTFTKNLLWSTYSMDAECLLDGTAGQILAVNVLEPYATGVHNNFRSNSPSLNRALRSISLIALSSERSSFAVAVEPRVNVLHRWPRPPKERVLPLDSYAAQQNRDEALYLPCLAWGWALTSGAGNVVLPILARSWGSCLQLLVSTFPSLDEDGTLGDHHHAHDSSQQPHWPAFGIHEEIDAESPIVALEWLSERSLVYLTLTNELTVIDTVLMTLLERLDFSSIRVVFSEFTLSRTVAEPVTHDDDTEGGQRNFIPITCTNFQNSVRCIDRRLMVICQDELRQISMIGAKQRISSLEADGEWLEALALALDYYEGTFTSQEDRKRDPNGRRDLSRHPEFSVPKGEEEEWIAKLLLRYLALAVDNAPNASADDNLMTLGNGRARINLAQSHFQMLAGVCVEYCVTTKRLDLLFGPIFRRFHSVGYTAVFLDVLEPYVLNDRLSYIAPEVMSYFVEHCKSNNGVATVERCLLHMDCTIMDFDSIIALLRNNDMYSAMFFVFNQGLNDYISPLQLLLERVFDEADNKVMRPQQSRQVDFERFGYKAILYLRFCFQGKSFPKEEPILPEERQMSVKPELFSFLTLFNYDLPDHARQRGSTASKSSHLGGHRSYKYPYMRLLLQVDPSLLFETIADALNERNSLQGNSSHTHYPFPTEQDIVDIFASIILPELTDDEGTTSKKPQIPLFKARQAISAFLDFTAKYITRSVVRVKKSLTLMIAKRIADRFAAAPNLAFRRAAQGEIMELLSALPRESYEPDKVLALIEKAGIHRAALLLHQQVASSSWEQMAESEDRQQLRAQHFCSAIDCFIGDDDAEFRLEVFDYIRKECTGIRRDSERGVDGRQPHNLAGAVYSRLRKLVRLDALRTARLVAELFVEDLDVVVDSLDDSDGGEAQFLFLQAIVSGELLEVDPVAGSVLNPSMDHHLKYLMLMAKLHPEKVYTYLSTHDNYRAEDALKLCEEYQIADASAYLLERMGNISSALQLILQTLEGRLMTLKRTLRGLEVDVFSHQHLMRFGHGVEDGINQLPSKQEQEAEGVKRILVVALDLCERNSGSGNTQTEQGSQLWFNVLDRLINAKGFLRLVNEQREHARIMETVLNDLLRLTMQRMVSNVPLLDLVRKVTSDHSGSRLGELREMVMSLLGTYGFELNLFGKAADVFHEDIANMKADRTGLILKAFPVKTKVSGSEDLTTAAAATTTLLVGSDGALVLEPNHGASRGMSSSASQAQGSIQQMMQRLRRRRVDKPSIPVAASVDLTQTDRKYYEGSLEPVVYQHAVGILGEAHHRGRLISFRQ